MPTAKKKTTSKTAEAPANAAAMMGFAPEALAGWRDIMTEWGRFVTDRLKQDAETQRAMLQCKTTAELFQVQTEFFQTAAKQYSEETMRLMQMMSETAGKSMSTGVSSRKYDDVPL